MEQIRCLRCVKCGKEYDVQETMYTCLTCGNEGTLDVVYNMPVVAQRWLKDLKRQTDVCTPGSIWRYRDVLPIRQDSRLPPLQVGWTPLYAAERLVTYYAEKENLVLPKSLYIKDDGRNPTASLKDRASVMAVVKALEFGQNVITCASTGNAASSLAGLAASLGIATYIFVPETAPKAKVAQLLMYGAHVIMVKGTYDQAYDLSLQATQEWGWYSRNSGYNPYLGEGKKTVALEICEQFAWQAPDKVFVAVGDGCIIGGIWKGLCDLYELGLIDRCPQVIGVQAEGASPLVTAFENGQPLCPLSQTHTVADSIAVGFPRDAAKALRAVRESGGQMIRVSDDEILNAMRVLARYTGVFAEPAGATPLAGLLKLSQQGQVDETERVVVVVTGNGLKDIDTAIRAAGKPVIVEPTFDAVKKVVRS